MAKRQVGRLVRGADGVRRFRWEEMSDEDVQALLAGRPMHDSATVEQAEKIAAARWQEIGGDAA